MCTAAKVHFLIGDLQLDGHSFGLFCQANGAHNHIFRFFEVFHRVGDEKLDAALATEAIFFAVMCVRRRFVVSDSQPYERASTGGANQGFHC